jgi:hypothetical protein
VICFLALAPSNRTALLPYEERLSYFICKVHADPYGRLMGNALYEISKAATL